MDACKSKEIENAELSVTTIIKDMDGVIVIEVEDTGCGMDSQTRKKVFRTFFTTKGLEGTGLGLLVTRKLVHAHGGKVSVDSVVGEGSTFRIELPKEKLPSVKSALN